MTTRPPIVQSAESITVFTDGFPETINKDHTNFERVKQAIRDEAWSTLVPLMNVPKGLVQFSDGNVQIVDDEFFFRGIQVTDYLVERIMEMFHDNMPIGPMVAYFENLMLNPNPQARKDQFKWLEKGNMPITDDGQIVAYKYVNEEYKSVHSGVWKETDGEWHLDQYDKYDHTVGSIVEMPREKCDDDPSQTCSSGLHFCSFSYLNVGYSKSTRIVMVKVHPRDITAIPNDYNHAKARCCRYEVIGEIDLAEHGDVLAGKKVVRGNKVSTLDDLVFTPEDDASVDQDHGFGVAATVLPVGDTKEATPDNLLDHVITITRELLDVETVTRDSKFIDDLGADSLDLVELVMAIEEAFDIEIPDDSAEQIVSVQDVVNWLSMKGVTDVCDRESEPEATEATEARLTFERDGKIYTSDEVLALLTKYGSQGAVARETGIPRSTFGGWLNKISEVREATSEVQLSFYHEKSGKTYTSQEVLDLLAAHGSQGAVERNAGIPRSTLRGWLSRIEDAKS